LEGWWENDIALRIAEEYLLPLKEKNNTISKVMGDGVWQKILCTGISILNHEICSAEKVDIERY